MSLLLSLWLPILLSAVVVFVISTLVHMVIKWHAFDYKGFANEEAVRTALRVDQPVQGVKYVVPHCADMKEMASEAMQKKYQEGPNVVVVFGPTGQPSMGKHLGQWFLLSLVIAAITAFVTARLVPHDHAYAIRAAKLEAQLDAAAKAYVNARRGIRVDNGQVVASSIYSWFQVDFGDSAKGVLDHVGRYADPALKRKLEGITTIADFAYDWSLNDVSK